MGLKSLIQRLLDSRTTPAQAANASKPGSAVPVDYNPSASVDNWGPVLSNSTAVSDGYIWATGRTTSDKGFFQINTQALQITTTGTSNPGGEILNLFTPVSKGQLFSVYGRYLEQVTVRLVKTIGGGYLRSFVSAITKRGELCLSRLSLCLPRSSFRTNPSGSAIKLCQTIQPSGLFTHLKAHPVNTSHRLTGMSLFTLVAMNGRKSGMETGASLSPQRVLPTSAFKCLSLKAPKLGMSFRTPWPTELKKRTLSLFQQSERDALTGGALC